MTEIPANSPEINAAAIAGSRGRAVTGSSRTQVLWPGCHRALDDPPHYVGTRASGTADEVVAE